MLFFNSSGTGTCDPLYSQSQNIIAAKASMVTSLTSNAGPLGCVAGKAC